MPPRTRTRLQKAGAEEQALKTTKSMSCGAWPPPPPLPASPGAKQVCGEDAAHVEASLKAELLHILKVLNLPSR